MANSSWAILLGVVLCVGCHSGAIYHNHHTLHAEGWHRSDTLQFVIPQRNITPGDYQLQIELRHTDAVDFRTLWISVEENSADSLHFVLDSLQCPLTTAEGRFTGSGHLRYQLSYPMKTLHLKGTHPVTLKLVHTMEREWMQGLTEVGVRVF